MVSSRAKLLMRAMGLSEPMSHLDPWQNNGQFLGEPMVLLLSPSNIWIPESYQTIDSMLLSKSHDETRARQICVACAATQHYSNV